MTLYEGFLTLWPLHACNYTRIYKCRHRVTGCARKLSTRNEFTALSVQIPNAMIENASKITGTA